MSQKIFNDKEIETLMQNKYPKQYILLKSTY